MKRLSGLVGVRKSYPSLFPGIPLEGHGWFIGIEQEPFASPGRRAWGVGRVVLRAGLRLKFDSTGVPDRLVGDGKTE